MLTGCFSSTVKTVIGSQFVQEKLSIALLVRREKLFFESTSGERWISVVFGDQALLLEIAVLQHCDFFFLNAMNTYLRL